MRPKERLILIGCPCASSETTVEGALADLRARVCLAIGVKKKSRRQSIHRECTVCPHLFHSDRLDAAEPSHYAGFAGRATAGLDRASFGVVITPIARAAVLGFALVVPSVACAEPILYRLFLRTGGTLISYGEFARVGDRVIVSMPVTAAIESPQLQLVTLPESAIDWTQTDRYSAAARHAHYVRTRAEADYAAMNAEVAQQLNEVALAPDAKARLAIAERARRTLVEWPVTHHNYRVDDVRQLVAMLDEILTELRAATGDHRFELALVASAVPPPHAELLPPPTSTDVIAQAIAAAQIVDVSVEKLSLLQSVLSALQAPQLAASVDRGWLEGTRRVVASMITTELTAERQYTGFGREFIQAAIGRASRGDVRGVEEIVRKAARKDAELGGRRPEQMAALMTALEAHLTAARQLRLEQDRWRGRVGIYRSYWRSVRPVLEELGRARHGLDEIRALAGPDLAGLGRLDAIVARVAHRLGRVTPPAEMAGAHGVLANAAHMAANAARLRRDAVGSGQLAAAWDASSAAAGAMMLLARARAEVQRVLTPPRLSLDPSYP